MDSMLLHSKSTKSSKRPEVREKFVNLLMRGDLLGLFSNSSSYKSGRWKGAMDTSGNAALELLKLSPYPLFQRPVVQYSLQQVYDKGIRITVSARIKPSL